MSVGNSRRIAGGAALAALLFSMAVGLGLGVREPSIHDEFSNLLLGDTFAHGRLANPSHPMWHHFETLHVFWTPTYASKYPPGPGFALALGQVLGHPVLGVWLASALLCGAVAWMLAPAFRPRWVAAGALLAVLTFAGASYWSQSYWGGSVAAAGSALVWGAGLRWCRARSARHAALLAAGLVVLALSRPFEGLVVSLPVLGAVLASCVRAGRGALGRSAAAALPVLTVGALFLGLYNLRTTGDPWLLPYQHHEALYASVPLWTFAEPRPAPDHRHESLRRLHEEYEGRWLEEGARRFHPAKLRRSVNFFLGPPGLLALLALPFALRAAWVRLALAGVALGGAASVLLATYGGMPHQIAPAAAPLLWLQVACLRRWASLSARRVGAAVVALVLFGHGARAAVGVARHERNPEHWTEQRAHVRERLEARPGRDLVIVRYGPRHNVHQEWVYNAADLEEAEVVWARSMGPARDAALLEAFPDRRAWRLRVGAPEVPPALAPLPR